MTQQVLRPYQEDALTAICTAVRGGQNRLLVQMATGLGKTSVLAALPSWPALQPWLTQFPASERKMLVIAHRTELIDQASARIHGAQPHLHVAVEQAERHASRFADVVVASIQTLTMNRCSRLKRLLKKHVFRIVVYDECFPGWTLVDGRRIDSLHCGDMVTSFDPCSGQVDQKRIVRVIRKRPHALVKVVTPAGSVVCTPNHRIWTPDGWATAEDLRSGDTIAVLDGVDRGTSNGRRCCQVLQVQEASADRHHVENVPLQEDEEGVLLKQVPSADALGEIVSHDGRDQSKVCLRENDGQESDAQEGYQEEGKRDIAGHGMEAERPGRQRTSGATPATPSRQGSRMADRGASADGLLSMDRPVPERLQVGHREHGHEDRRGSRREQSLFETRAGRQEGQVLNWTRVDSVEVLEQGSDGRFGGVCQDGVVYNLEVEDFHTYTANGIVVSNCHHASSQSARTALVHLGFLPPSDASEEESLDAPTYDDVQVMEAALREWDQVSPKDRVLCGFSATPNRADGVGLGAVFQQIVYEHGIKKAIDDGWLVRIVPWVIETRANLDDVKLSHGDFNQKQLAEAVNTHERNKLAVAGWLEHAPGRPTIAFTVDVAHAHALAAEFTRQGVSARAVSGETPRDERREILRQFTREEIAVITNCQIMGEGVDLPLASCVLMAKPTRSATAYAQAVGRGLRIYPGKEDCIVIDVCDVARKHSLQTAPVLYGLPPSLVVNGKTLDQAEDELDAFLEKHPGFEIEKHGRKTLKELNAIASTFNIWDVRPMEAYGTGLAMAWIRTGDESFRLEYPWLDGKEVLTVKKDLLGHFDLHVVYRPTQGVTGDALGALAAEPRVLGAGLPDARAGLTLAENYVRQARPSVMRITDQSAPWRARPASAPQISLLRRWGVPTPKGMTMGEASTKINATKLSRGLR